MNLYKVKVGSGALCLLNNISIQAYSNFFGSDERMKKAANKNVPQIDYKILRRRQIKVQSSVGISARNLIKN